MVKTLLLLNSSQTMNEPDDPHELLLELLHNAVPPGVVEDIAVDAPGFLMEEFFPAPVVNDILANWHNPPPPPPNLEKDAFLSYKDVEIERRYLKWEAEHSRSHMGLCSFLILCCFVVHLAQCMQNADGAWICADSMTLCLATFLIWLPLVALILPAPYNWQYKECISAIHQCLFGVMVSSYVFMYFQRVASNSSSCGTWKPDFVVVCTVPVLVESVLFKVRLKYHFALNLLLISLVVVPWLSHGEFTHSISDVAVNVAAAVIMSSCFISLYQTHVQKKFEGTLS